MNISRRDFIKWMGFGTVAATLSACKGKVIHSIPYVVKPDTIIPGNPNYYATTMFDGFDISSVIVKTREGRPIKIDKNDLSKNFNNSSARIQASLLSLYDNERLKNPIINNKKVTWKELDNYVIKKLNNVKKNKKKISIITSSLPSPSTKKIILDFSKKYSNTEIVVYDSISYSNFLDASESVLGYRGLPKYNLSEIELIVSFNADFLGDWTPDCIKNSYSNNRDPKKNMLRHIQIENNMTLSGANADLRIPVKPSMCKKMLLELYNNIVYNIETNNIIIKKIVREIKNKGKKTLIFADGDKECYIISLLINNFISSYGISKDKFILSKESNDKKFETFLNELEYGNIGAVLLYQNNPIYSLPILKKKQFKKGLSNLDISISFSSYYDETSKFINVLSPTHHWLESWGDTNPLTGMYTLMQPTINPIFNTRQFQDTLLVWKNYNTKKKIISNHDELYNNTSKVDYINNYYDFLKKFWEDTILPKSNLNNFEEALFNGVLEINEIPKKNKFLLQNLDKIQINNYNNYKNSSFELELYSKTGTGDGRQFTNPWLYEFPDPITRTTWDNYITISPEDANKLGLKNWNIGNGAMDSSKVNIIADNIKIKNIPVYIQPGQAIGSLGFALGYGHNLKEKYNIGINAFHIYKNFNKIQYNIKIEKIDGHHEFACIQLQNTTVGRKDIAKETKLKIFLNNKKEEWNKKENYNTYKGYVNVDKLSIWNEFDQKNGHHFNLSIDLNSCIGCGTCVMACNVENNIPVVGKSEIRKSRDMHWLRIDRYYSTTEDFESLQDNNLSTKNIFSEPENYNYLLNPESNPKIIFQPIMCQHCNHAPCETVCPVSATSHGKQGQNMMVYNRCIGTRYCANNCPYKVRRFNWFSYSNNDNFDFHMNNDIGRMVLNPDVVVRSRGVMEKCSLCIQMTQSVILNAKKEKRKIKDGEFKTACTESCPTNALTFGDINDKNSKIYKKINNNRTYRLLESIGTKPNISYQVKIRNSE